MGIEFGIPGVKPFVVQNLGKYERQAWQEAEFPSNGQNHLEEQRERESACRRFILDLYHAKPMNGHAWIHGTKSGRMVHVGAVDAPETLADVNGHPRRNAAPHRVLGSRHVMQCFVAESNRILAVPGTRLWDVPGSQKLHIFRSSNGNPGAVGREEGRRTERIAQSITSPRSRRAPARTPPPPLAPHRR